MGRKAISKYIDYGFFDRYENRDRRKLHLSFIEMGVKQLLDEGNKLLPLAERFDRLSGDDKRRFTEALAAIQSWVDTMRELAFGDADPDETRERPIDKNGY